MEDFFLLLLIYENSEQVSYNSVIRGVWWAQCSPAGPLHDLVLPPGIGKCATAASSLPGGYKNTGRHGYSDQSTHTPPLPRIFSIFSTTLLSDIALTFEGRLYSSVSHFPHEITLENRERVLRP